MQGYGEFYDLKKNVLYIGFFYENYYHGFGILREYNQNYIYVGEWKKNSRDGIARFFKGKKESFGKFKNNKRIINYETSKDILNFFDDKYMHLASFLTTKRYEDIVKFASKKRIMDA